MSLQESTSNFPRDFKGIWIPREIWLHQELCAEEKLLWAEIDSLDGPDGCFASNDYFCKFFGWQERTLQKYLAKLKALGFVKMQSFDGRKRILKCIKQQSNEKFDTPEVNEKTTNEKFDTPDLNNCSPLPCTNIHPSIMGEPIEREIKGYNKAESLAKLSAREDSKKIHDSQINLRKQDSIENLKEKVEFLKSIDFPGGKKLKQSNVEQWAKLYSLPRLKKMKMKVTYMYIQGKDFPNPDGLVYKILTDPNCESTYEIEETREKVFEWLQSKGKRWFCDGDYVIARELDKELSLKLGYSTLIKEMERWCENN